MILAFYGAIVFSVALLVITAYFMLGGLPLLVLKHEVTLDARFIRSFFNLYYRVAFWAAVGACLSYALWGRYAFAAGAAGIAMVVSWLRMRLIPAMQNLGEQIAASEEAAIQKFKRVHIMALIINFIQLIVIVWSVTQLKP